MILSPKQKESIKGANKRLNIWEGAVRSSKTWGSLFRWIQFVGKEASPEADLLLIARTERTAYRNIIKPLEMLVGNDCQYTQGRGELRLFDRTINVFGANDERAEGKIRGLTAAGAYGDEVSLWPKSFFNMMLSRLSVENAKFFGTTNPDSPYHYLKTEYIDRQFELDMAVFSFQLDDNPFLSDEFKNNLKKEYRGLWYKRFILGQWCMAEGAVYDFFDEDEHTLTFLPPADSRYVAIDYGTGNPTCFLLFGVNMALRPFCWLEREYYYDSVAVGRSKTDGEYSKDLKKFLGNILPEAIIVDPSAASFKVQLERDGFMFIRDADNSVIDGIRTQARMLVSGEYGIHHSCRRTITDYAAYLWDMKAQRRGEDKPLKQNDHTKDPERYFLQTMFGTNAINYNLLTKE